MLCSFGLKIAQMFLEFYAIVQRQLSGVIGQGHRIVIQQGGPLRKNEKIVENIFFFFFIL